MKLITPIFFILSYCFFGCNGSSKPTEAAKTETAASPTISDAATLLQGKWQSADDPKSSMEIAGKTIINTYDGKQIDSRTFEYVADCSGNACAGGSGKSGCFTSAGQFDIECYSIVSLSATEMEVSMVGATGKTLKYSKMK